MPQVDDEFPVELVELAQLRRHPRNYREHPQDEVDHLKASLTEDGVYKNVVVAGDGLTLLAGHGVVDAMRQLATEAPPQGWVGGRAAWKRRWARVPVRRLSHDPDSPRALRVLAADNYVSHLAVDDDRQLTELLRDVRDGVGLFGTGFDDAMLANLVMVTRTEREIPDQDAAAHWVGLPAYENGERALRVTVNFLNADDRKRFAELLGIPVPGDTGRAASIWFPPRERDDLASIRFSASSNGNGSQPEQ